MERSVARKRFQRKMSQKKKAQLQAEREKEPEWDSETDSDEDWDYDSEDEEKELEEWEEKIVEKYGKLALKKYKITKQYNVEEITVPFLEAIHGMTQKHLNLKNFGPVSGVQDVRQKDIIFRKIVQQLLVEARGKQDISSDSHDTFAAICDMETMRDIKPCFHAINILRLIGCVNFLDSLPWKQLSNDIEPKLQEYIHSHHDDISMIVSDIKCLTPIECASEVLFNTFGIKIRNSKGVPYIKSIWIWDKVHNRILPKTSDGKDNRLLPVKT